MRLILLLIALIAIPAPAAADVKARYTGTGGAALIEVGGNGDVRMGGNIRVPIKLRDFRPRYPEALHGTSGAVVLKTTIGLTGSVENIEVVSATHPGFTEAAIDAVRQWEFDATLLNCERVETDMQVTVNFKAQ